MYNITEFVLETELRTSRINVADNLTKPNNTIFRLQNATHPLA